MSRSPGGWLKIAGLWLGLCGATHLGWHVWMIVLENGMVGLRDFAMNAMVQARFTDPLTTSLWRYFRFFSVAFGVLLVFAGAVNTLLSGRDVSRALQRRYALLSTFFWTFAFVPFAFTDLVLQGLAVSAVAVPLHGVAYLVATQEVNEDPQ